MSPSKSILVAAETVVLAHLNGAGMGMKHSNIHGAFCCSGCHQWLDGGWSNIRMTQEQSDQMRIRRDLSHLQAVIRTQQIMIKEGILKL